MLTAHLSRVQKLGCKSQTSISASSGIGAELLLSQAGSITCNILFISADMQYLHLIYGYPSALVSRVAPAATCEGYTTACSCGRRCCWAVLMPALTAVHAPVRERTRSTVRKLGRQYQVGCMHASTRSWYMGSVFMGQASARPFLFLRSACLVGCMHLRACPADAGMPTGRCQSRLYSAAAGCRGSRHTLSAMESCSFVRPLWGATPHSISYSTAPRA